LIKEHTLETNRTWDLFMVSRSNIQAFAEYHQYF
jgi:hypothetical protein